MKYLFTLLILVLVATIGINVAIADDTPSSEVSKIDQADVTVDQFAFTYSERSILLKAFYVRSQYKTKYLTASLYIDPGNCLAGKIEFKLTKNLLTVYSLTNSETKLKAKAFYGGVSANLRIDPGICFHG